MKAKISYLFAALLAASLVSCGDETEELLPVEVQEVANDSVLISTHPLGESGQRGLRAMATEQTQEGTQPDRKGQKGRDHRDYVGDPFSDTRLRSFTTGSVLKYGELYVIDKDNTSDHYTFKFYFGNESEIPESLKKYDNSRAFMYIHQDNGWQVPAYGNDYYRIGETFTIPKNQLRYWTVIEYGFRQGYNNPYRVDERTKIMFGDLYFTNEIYSR